MYFHRVFVGLCLSIISTACFSHVAGITDTAIKVNSDNIEVIYTLPADNINEFIDIQRSEINNTVIQGFLISNEIDNKTQVCNGEILSTQQLESIQSEQFNIRYTCDNKLDNLLISYSLLFAKDKTHKNHVRLSIAGRSQRFIYSDLKKTHALPIKKLLTSWSGSVNEKNKPKESKIKNSRNVTSFSDLILQSADYFLIGVEHILLGYDHVLFLIGLLLLPLSFRSILIIATSFTLAHSITLALSALDIFTLPVVYVEAIIALSIVYIAIDNIRILKSNGMQSKINKTLLPWRKRSLITFLFGLLHGFGFSYVLKEIGLGEHLVGSLLFFNLGVEFGQLLIISVCFPILLYVFRKKWGIKSTIVFSFLVGLMGLFWLIERISVLF